MHDEMNIITENGENLRLIALFDTLKESDKDIVIMMADSLVQKYKNDVVKPAGNNNEKRRSL